MQPNDTHSSKDSVQRTILIIDDDRGLQTIFSLAIQRSGYRVIGREDAYTGLKWLEQILPDLILLDMMLPGISGMEMLKQIRATENGKHVPIMVVTAHANLTADHFTQWGIINFFSKPILPSDIVKAINDYFGIPSSVGV